MYINVVAPLTIFNLTDILQLFQMEELRGRRFDGHARVIQRAFRKYFAQRQRQKQREEAAGKNKIQQLFIGTANM